MRARSIAAAAWACAAIVGAAAGQETRKVAGRVVDGAGKPVAGAEVATFWQGRDGGMQPFGAAKADEDGRFTVEVRLYGRDTGLMALDKDRTRGGIAVVAAQKPGEAVEVRLTPLVRVRGKFSCTELGAPPDWTNVYMSRMPGDLRIAACDSRDATFDLKLPAGEYKFNGYASFTDYEGVNKTVTLEADRPELDLGTIDLKAAPLAKHYGKAPPAWNVTEARGVGKDVRLADFKGKWVLLEFWGFW